MAREHRPDERPTAEEMLERVRREAGAGARGRHRVYLGMAPGVGKTYTALEELHRRKERGTDVAIAFVETYNRPLTIKAIGELEIIPRKRIDYKGVTLEEMDTEAVIRRHPAVVLVDELAHTNAPGSKHEKRWQDVADILDAGITVVSTMNVQHLDSLADIVENITGTTVRERIPDHIVDGADELELVDMTPHALQQRMRHGNVYPPERAERALDQFFREGNLMALRELALRKVAQDVEDDLEHYMRQNEIDASWAASEAVLVAVDEHPVSRQLVRRGWHLAEQRQSPFVATFIETPRWAHASPEARRQLEENLRLAEDLGADVIRVQADDVADGLMRAAHERNVDSIVIGQSRHGRLHELIRGSVVHKLLRRAGDVDVHVVAERDTHRPA